MKTVLQLLFLLVAALLFTTIQSLLLRKSGRTSLTFVKEELERAGNSKTYCRIQTGSINLIDISTLMVFGMFKICLSFQRLQQSNGLII